MNDARQLYLNTYYVIDNIDHMLKNCRMPYLCRKYWHSPKNNRKALAALIAHDTYQECTEGTVLE
eukprot:6432412-Ditylum_brightwellii.AAC.1